MVESEATLGIMDVATANGVFNEGNIGHRYVQFFPAAAAAAARAGGDQDEEEETEMASGDKKLPPNASRIAGSGPSVTSRE